MDKATGRLVQKSLAQGLGLPDEGYVIFKDYVSGLEYIRPSREMVENGLYVELKGYQCHVFLDFRFVGGEQPVLSPALRNEGAANGWKLVCEVLNGAGVPSVLAMFDELFAPKVEVKEAQPKKVAKKRVVEKKGTRKKARSKRAKMTVL